ncbi:PPE family protein [Mycobacterium helveticum]|uniref:PPE family protein n=1 Tax=Mycobacterium helveticum TaxID=2592811 RepID=A0A557Y056_9MYCO|nr:PPE family protein [Mycobacterium helveticum]TVS88467.1 PPE family protein [Mycobacterium helveticum]TVS91926.1 PPE family protein [Mycobacterium helveticum]
MDFGSLPPEINSGRMYAGPGAAPLLAAAAAWDALANELELTATGYASVVSELTGIEWTGPSSTIMASAAAPYAEWLQASAAQAERTAIQAKAAAAAYEVAFAATVPPPVIAANRATLAALVATNFFGQNTPAIMATEAHYAEMWAQDATAMYTYASASSAASVLTPFREPPLTTNAAGLDTQAGAVAQAGASTATHAQAAASSAASTLSPSALLAFLDSTAGGLTVQGLGWVNQAVGDTTNVPLGYFTAFYTIGTNAFGYWREGLVRGGMAGYTWFEGLGGFNNLSGVGGSLGGLGKTALLGPNVAGLPTAGMPGAYSIGALSVPPSWATAAAGAKTVAVSLAATNAGAAPAAAAGLPPGMAMQEAMVGTTSGGGAASAVADSHGGDRNGKNRPGKDDKEKEGERPAAALIMASGWLASTLAYNNRRRAEPAPSSLPLPPHWQEELAANEFAWG